METHVPAEKRSENEQRAYSFPVENSCVVQNREDPAISTLHEHQRKFEEQRCLLDELARIEQDLKENISREEMRQQEQNLVRREENRIRWRSLSFLSLNQRTTKPWVTSYYKNIPMHIYCLPIETVVRKQNKKWIKR